MVRVARFVQEKLNRDAEIERQTVALKKNKNVVWIEKPFEWQKKQSLKAILFPTYGWVPKTAVAWRKPDGLIVPWSLGHNDTDTFLLADWIVKEKGLK